MQKKYQISDVNRGDILNLLKSNIDKNSPSRNIQIQEIDFFWDTYPEDVLQSLRSCNIVLAADVVYDESITRHFFKTLRNILKFGGKTVLIAIERRLRTDEGGQLVAPNFEIFSQQLAALDTEVLNGQAVMVQQLNIDFPKYFEYSRVPELTLWQIVLK